jgi:DNA-binding LacI/PurR family transcriptional regulator
MGIKSSQPSAVDVAKKAGVSRTQVSYVLNNTRADHVSAENREKILAAARDLGYQPHQSAQALRRGFANEFGLFFPAPYTARINAMLGTIHETGLADGCLPVQYSFNSYHEPERKREAFRALLARKPRGLFCSLLDIDQAFLDEARDRGVEKILVFDIEDHTGSPTLALPTEAIGFLAIQHLLFRGHHDIGILKPSDPIQERAYALRMAGARKALAQVSGCRLHEFPWPAENLRPTPPFAGVFLKETGLLSSGITALYTYSDEFALPLLAELLDQGVSVPRDLALVGTDDLPLATLTRPALTTIRFDQDTLGHRAVALINALITDEAPPLEHQRPLTPQLVLRQTT